MPALQPFTPGATVAVAATTSSANAALNRKSADQVRIVNVAGATAFVNFGGSTVTATSANTPVVSGATEIFTIPRGATHIAVILATGSGNVYATPGDGQ